MSWEVVERMTIYHEEGMYALAPNVVRTPSGDLMVFFQRAPHLVGGLPGELALLWGERTETPEQECDLALLAEILGPPGIGGRDI